VVAAQGGRTHGYEHAARVNGTLSERRHRSGGGRRGAVTGNPTRAALEASLTTAHGNHEKRTGEADLDGTTGMPRTSSPQQARAALPQRSRHHGVSTQERYLSSGKHNQDSGNEKETNPHGEL
jgi:hypothetical protein